MPYYKSDAVRDAAHGNWLFVLAALADQIEPALRKPGKHASCPVHGGKDGFRLFKDAHQTGGGVCNTCGPRHDGFELLMWLNGWDFKQCLEAVGDFLGLEKENAREDRRSALKAPPARQAATRVNGRNYAPVEYGPPAPKEAAQQAASASEAKGRLVPLFKEHAKLWLLELQEEMERAMERQRAYSARLHEKIEQIWNECLLYSSGACEPMRRYLQSRGLLIPVDSVEQSDCLRFHPSLSYFDEDGIKIGSFPAIVCAIRDVDGNMVTLHRTYLTPNGKKAKVGSARKMMPVPDGLSVVGASIRLGEPAEGVLGVAEGLETALSAYRVSRFPVWSTVNATLMESFEVSQGVHTVLIWADRDKSLTGERSANVLKAKLEKQGIQVYVLLPKLPIPARAKGVDWNDVLLSQGRLGFPQPRYLRDFIARSGIDYSMNKVDPTPGRNVESPPHPTSGGEGHHTECMNHVSDRSHDFGFVCA